MSFSCPHFDPNRDFCLRLNTDCVPGRRGCVLGKKVVFAVPVEERLREKELEKRERRDAEWARLNAAGRRPGGGGR